MIGRLNHVAIAVPDLDAAADQYRSALGAKVGAPQDEPDHGVTVIFIELPNTKIELLYPLGENSPIQGFLDKNPSGGIHHVCYEVEDIIAARDHLKATGARVIVANARLSEKSFRGYEKFAKLGKPMLQAIDCIAAQAEPDAARFERLGVARERLTITGSIKFEIDLPDDLAQKRDAMKASFAGTRPVLIAASTREGEEEHVLHAFKQCLQTMPDLLLILVPRHPERFKPVARLCEQKGLTLVKRSEHSVVTEQTQVFLGDSMGEMLTYFSVSDVAFVGGSLVNTGCHNVLEPAALGLPVIVGPSQFNFQSICEQLESAGALKTVPDANGLAQAVLQVFADESLRHTMGAAGRQLIEDNRGALQRIETLVWQACQATRI